MFVSQPEYEFPFPPDLAHPGSQHWRLVELTLHAPWFLLSVEINDPEFPDVSMTRTLCIAWDSDLAELLATMEPHRVKGIVCMMPAWRSTSGQWTSREIREVWCWRSTAGRSVVLIDTAGENFDCGIAPDHQAPIEKELLLRIEPAAAPRRHGRSASRKVRRAGARKVDA